MTRRQFLLATAALAASSHVKAAERKIALGIDNFSVRAMAWKAPALIDYAAGLRCDTLFLSDLDCLESLEAPYLQTIRESAAAKGLKLYAGGWSICPTSIRFKNNWGTAEEHLRLGIRVAKALGSPVYRVVLGAMEDRKTPGGIRARMDDMLAVLKTCRSDATDAGIKVAIENHAGDLHSWELAELVESAGKDWVGVNIDSGNAAWTLEDPLDVLERLGPYTLCSSLRDDQIWTTPEGASVQWTAIGEGLLPWTKWVERWKVLCPEVPFMIETISGFTKAFPYRDETFWANYDKRPAALAAFEALAARGKPIPPFKAPEGADKKIAEQNYQRGEVERSVTYCREKLGLGIRA